MRVVHDLSDDGDEEFRFLEQCWLAYLSDDLATDTVRAAYRTWAAGSGDLAAGDEDALFGVSLDHTVWFHRPMRPDRWHLHDFSCHHFSGARGLAVGHVFTVEGEHVATVSQEVLVRRRRD